MAENTTRTVGRTLKLLTEACVDGPIGMSVVSQRVGPSPSTALRLLAMLAQDGFVTRDPEGHVQPGAQVVHLGALDLSHDSLISLAEPAMRHSVEATGESCYLSIRSTTDTDPQVAPQEDELET